MNSQSLNTVQRLAAEALDMPLEAMVPTLPFRHAGIDSLSTIDVLFAVESHFDIAFPPDELVHMQTLADVAATVDRLTAREARRYG